ncbi:xanthine dehydrogenase family protein molybdopterin-binding subunit [Lacisediminimonas sp.]|uniref:xanthine dehydrogenase family protein molybdopterin-binding subunit n=1 Tax=Lacisediminimonas sp. TaxID=3060582 RepID=UPI002720D933|nr:xanthine dehydrogenase family protein molybdopterin-binding subunit [Lacisediminimonas sp.]MDO8299430.1 xanthine dehydrogenase family protein molybdopterin-binding subunit [Lacisediminimonas sp.]
MGKSEPALYLGAARAEHAERIEDPALLRKSGEAASPMIGQALPLREDIRFLTGTGCYVDDIKRPDMAHAMVVRSALAHARIRAVDISAALALPGVLAVYSADDIRDYALPIPQRVCALPGLERFLQMPLADERARYVGEPIAMVVATSRAIAQDAAELVQVDYEQLPAVVDVHAALADQVILHDGPGTNLASHYTVGRGDADAAFANAHYTRSEVFNIHRHTALTLETRGFVAEWDAAAGRMQVWGGSKVLFANRTILASMLKLDEQCIDMIEVDIGGGFGVRGDFYPEDFLVPFAAMKLGRPVKWIEDRREHLMATNHSREMECRLEIAVSADGIILAMRGLLMADMGAYTRTNGGVGPGKGTQFLQGPYLIPHLEFEVQALMTNKTPVGTYRGPGRYESTFFRERLLDIAAVELGLDPAEFRLKNLIPPEAMPYDAGALVPGLPSTIYDTGDYPLVLRRALAEADYPALVAGRGRGADGRLYGVGMGCFVESTGGGPSEDARIQVTPDGRVELFIGASSAGQGHETVMAQVLADELDIGMDAIRVFHGSTTLVKRGFGAYHSRSAVMSGGAIVLVAQRLRQQLLAHVAASSGRAVESLTFARGAVRGSNDGAVLATLESLAQQASAGSVQAASALAAEATFSNDNQLTYTGGTQIAHVAVDTETAMVEVLRLLTVEDVGRMINPAVVHGQTIGAAVQGLGGTFLDEFVYDEQGQLLTGTLADYLLPTATDFPNVDGVSMEHARSLSNPLGVKGAGEGGIIATGAALANAVADALSPLGVQITRLPLSPNNIARLIRDAKARPGPGN